MKNSNNSITLDGLRGILPFVSLLVIAVMGWASFIAQLDLVRQKADVTDKRLESIDKDLDEVNNKQQVMNEQLIKLTTIIETAQNNGQLGRMRNNVVLASNKHLVITPTPTVQKENTNTIVLLQSKEQAATQEKVSEPTPKPTPTPQRNIGPSLLTPILEILL